MHKYFIFIFFTLEVKTCLSSHFSFCDKSHSVTPGICNPGIARAKVMCLKRQKRVNTQSFPNTTLFAYSIDLSLKFCQLKRISAFLCSKLSSGSFSDISPFMIPVSRSRLYHGQYFFTFFSVLLLWCFSLSLLNYCYSSYICIFLPGQILSSLETQAINSIESDIIGRYQTSHLNSPYSRVLYL